MTRNRSYAAILVALSFFIISACDQGPTAPTATPAVTPAQTAPTESNTPPPTNAPVTAVTPRSTPTIDFANPTKVTLALGYTPDIQFAPFYVALNKGYYKDLGIDVIVKHGIVPDLIKQLGTGEGGVNFAVASGDEVIPARLQDIPVVYVMTWYRQYPVAAASIKGKGPALASPADLKGHSVGVPGPYGSTYTGLLALLKSGGLTLDDIQLKTIGFTQIESLVNNQVEVAMVYSANEPVQLRAEGYDISTLQVADHSKLASNGLVTNIDTFKNAMLVSRMVEATRRGIEDTIKDPAGAFESSLKQVPEAGGTNRGRQMKVLEETIKLMQAKPGDPAAGQPLGWTDAQVWADTQQFLLDSKIINKTGKVQEMFSNRFVLSLPE